MKCLLKYCIFFGCLCLGISSYAQKKSYLDLNLGMVNHASQQKMAQVIDQIAGDHSSNQANFLHFNYAWSVGGDIGLQINHFLGLEGGGLIFQDRTIQANENIPDSGSVMKSGDQVQMKSWLTYLVMKAKAPLIRMIDMYAKVGAGYQQQNFGSNNTQTANAIDHGFGQDHHWTPVLTLGLEDQLSQSIHLKLQYMYAPAHWDMFKAIPDNNTDGLTPKHIYTLSLGYYFSL